jgi:hypothetical protein
MFHTEKQHYALNLLDRRFVSEIRVNCDMRLQVLILRQGMRVLVCPNSNGGRRPVEVKERMDKLTSWKYGSDVSIRQKLCAV